MTQLVALQSWMRSEVLVEHRGRSRGQAASWFQAVAASARFELQVRVLRVQEAHEVVKVEEGRKGRRRPRGRYRRCHCRTAQYRRLQ